MRADHSARAGRRLGPRWQAVILGLSVLAACREPADNAERAPLIPIASQGELNAVVIGDGSGTSPRLCGTLAPTQGTLKGKPLVSEDGPVHFGWTPDIAVGGQGSVYIVDRTGKRVTQLDSTGNVLTEFGAVQNLGLVRTAALGKDGTLHVGQAGGSIVVLSDSGRRIRAMRVSKFFEISDVVALPNRNIVAATFAHATRKGKNAAYVKLLDPAGRVLVNLRSLTAKRVLGDRPLLLSNTEVRLAVGPLGRFAVWYPVENFVEVFDSTGVLLAELRGCLPAELTNFYRRQFGNGRESSQDLTLGVSFAGPDRIRVISRYRSKNGYFFRLRTYALNGREQSARDYELPNGSLVRVEFDTDSTMLVYGHEQIRREIIRYHLR
jgi:hypothetical protein